MGTAKVINLNHKEENRRMSVPELLKSSKRMAEKRLQGLMDTMFKNADECLFEYADKAATNEKQTTYMDAMRELRIRKPEMQEAFFYDFDQQFVNQLNSPDSNAAAKSAELSSDAGLTLVDEDDLEESLAITNMANRVYIAHRETLSALVLRMNEVCSENSFEKESNPLSPFVICHAFSQSVACLSTSLEIKLIIYKLFDKFVVCNLGRLYHEINEMYVTAGILPTIKYKKPVINSAKSKSEKHKVETKTEPNSHPQTQTQHQHQTQPLQVPAATGPAASQIPTNVFDTMRQALYEYRGEPMPQQTHAGATILSASKSSPVDKQQGDSKAVVGDNKSSALRDANMYYVSSDIIAGLSSIQNNTAIASFYGGSQNSGEVIKTKLLKAVVQSNDCSNEKSISHSESDVIDIVSMMFDYILNDKSLPERTKTVIARLQIPMVKVAILDKAFFNKKSHPARALLNELAYASNVLDSDYDDAETLFQEVERVVGRVLDEFDSNIELFSQLLEEFLEFLATEIKANKLAEHMILDAKQKVADEIEKRMRRYNVPSAVSRFIFGPWKDVMNTIGIRDQCEGIAWNTATTFLDDLIWSVQPKLFSEDRKQLNQLIPRILPSIREGVELLEQNDFDLPAFLQELQHLHLQALHVEKQHNKIASIADTFDTNEIVDNDDSQDNKQDRFEFDMNDPRLKQSLFFETAKDMEVGTWVEFDFKQGKKCGKLTWKCDFTGEYTFMNRMYKVVADLSMRELIDRLEAGSARIAEDIPIFDRAVNAIISSMKQMTDGLRHKQAALN